MRECDVCWFVMDKISIEKEKEKKKKKKEKEKKDLEAGRGRRHEGGYGKLFVFQKQDDNEGILLLLGRQL